MSTVPASFAQIAKGGLRRYIWPAVITVVLISFLQHNLHPLGPAVDSDVYDPQSKVNHGRFSWTDVPEKHPPPSIKHLPKGQPKSLPRVQHEFPPETESEISKRRSRQAAVKRAFTRCWDSYKGRAWLSDELTPISGKSRNTFGGWAATLVDSLDSLYIMGMKAEFDQAVSALRYIDFGHPDQETVNIFETTIRYLGGFLAAYDLSGDKELLDKAIEVGELIYVSFDTPNRMPVTRFTWKPVAEGAQQVAAPNALVAEIGSLSVELTRLSQVTNDPKWFDAVQRISEVFLAQQNHTKLPGMWPVWFNAEMADSTGSAGFTLGGMSDSLYEYFPKEYALLGGLDPMYRDLYIGSMKTAIKHNFFRPMVPDEADILFSGNIRADNPQNPILDPECQHLACFAGGMLALGGRLFNLPEHVNIGRRLVDGCVYAYNATPIGIMPEKFHMVPCDSNESCTWNQDTWHAAIESRTKTHGIPTVEQLISFKRLPPGFTQIDDQRYILRPEAIESVFILYRITGDKALQDAAWQMFENIERYTKTDLGNAALVDVTVTNGFPSKSDSMESFWTAETLKYFYLIFSEPDLISLDDYVFNTEAHPFRRPK